MVTSTPIAAAVVARMNGGYAQSNEPFVTMIDIDLALFDSLDDMLALPQSRCRPQKTDLLISIPEYVAAPIVNGVAPGIPESCGVSPHLTSRDGSAAG